ncbi:hypothetical protein D3C80_1353310 [compost metagenome]
MFYTVRIRIGWNIEHKLSFFSGFDPPKIHLIYCHCRKIGDNRDVRSFAWSEHSDIRKPKMGCRIDRHHLNRFNRIDSRSDCTANNIIHMPKLKQILRHHIIRY